MNPAFIVYEIDEPHLSESGELRTVIHGRALMILSIQTVLSSKELDCIVRIENIVSYGNALDKIDAMMGCSISVVSTCHSISDLKELYLQ